jgi:hypothetical protein
MNSVSQRTKSTFAFWNILRFHSFMCVISVRRVGPPFIPLIFPKTRPPILLLNKRHKDRHVSWRDFSATTYRYVPRKRTQGASVNKFSASSLLTSPIITTRQLVNLSTTTRKSDVSKLSLRTKHTRDIHTKFGSNLTY